MRVSNLLIARQNRNNALIELLKQQNKCKIMAKLPDGGRDIYLPGENSVYRIYGQKAECYGKYSTTILDAINFEHVTLPEDEAYFTIGGVKYLKKDVPQVDCDRCMEIKAENNEILFENGKYYKYKDRDGKYRALACLYDDVSQPYSEQMVGKVCKESDEMGKFWSVLGCEGVYGSMYYSKDEQRKLLNDAGIKEGFFSVQVGTKKTELFYSNGVAGVVVPKRRYDSTYNMFMNTNILEDFAVGSVFVIGGKEYTLNADKKLDIPYGADIYDIKYPLRENQ